MHCYFVLAGDAEIPIVYHVEHVREGKSFATRTVQARQRGRPIFTTTMSFVREGSGGKKLVQHATPMPDVPIPEDNPELDGGITALEKGGGPFVSRRIEILNKHSPDIHTKRTRQWIKARGSISPSGGHQAHLSALAYMSDSYFIGTVSRVHQLQRFTAPGPGVSKASLAKSGLSEDQMKKYFQRWANQEGVDFEGLTDKDRADKPQVGMMVSLDHVIYFHNPRAFRADEWMFTEMESPWAGDGRGLVCQKMWSKDGVLVATCVQEVRCPFSFFFSIIERQRIEE
jgi:acyl-CoA thioesterase